MAPPAGANKQAQFLFVFEHFGRIEFVSIEYGALRRPPPWLEGSRNGP